MYIIKRFMIPQSNSIYNPDSKQFIRHLYTKTLNNSTNLSCKKLDSKLTRVNFASNYVSDIPVKVLAEFFWFDALSLITKKRIRQYQS